MHTRIAPEATVRQRIGVSKINTRPSFVPRRGRPSAEQVEAIERSILSTARRMFLEDGYDAVAMEVVALTAGVSKGTLYARHSAKDALFRAVVESSVADWSASAAVEDHLLTDDLEERLRHHARITARYMLEPEVQAFQRLLLTNRHRFPDLSRAMYDTGYSYFIDLIRQDIEVAAKKDGHPVRDADGIARQLVATITGWHYQESAARDLTLQELTAVADRTVTLLMAARPLW